MAFPYVRLRRLRRTAAIREMFDAAPPPPARLVWPVFLVEGENRVEPIASMPGQNRRSADELERALEPVAAQGVGGVLLFGQTEGDKDEGGSAAFDDHGVVQRALPRIKRAYPDMVVMTDVCLCAYTRHGHCGPIGRDGNVDNDAANGLLARVAVSHAAAGADVVAPSAMMDGQVAAIREALAENGLDDTLLMSYSTKFASSMYGPFRDAENSAPSSGDRRGYQASYANLRAALRESRFDEAEGADILMVKPALFYLDVIARVREQTELPLAAYNVSGEYSMLHAAAEQGYGDLYAMARESLTAIGRAGADIILSYWAPFYARMFGKQ
ncbi:MAG: porphobilinogen synthase [Kiritimatiellae bacterium]|nr:porphobilinogen synthase [Kiritimatiellia bacterium]MDD4026256.1 porphobilinogen synthase [Kiritimatiellia bacterium]MDD4621851.1 porphobilinogen synthase [Kiritimatiellia bacterium]